LERDTIEKKRMVRAVKQDHRLTILVRRHSTCIVYTAFVGTGIGAALPGAVLPTLLIRWSITDAQAGELLFLFFLGSATGAFVSRGLLSRSIARGSLILAIGSLLLVAAQRHLEFVAMPIYGMGLGIVMTSISLRQSRRNPDNRTAEMARLNFFWVLGACLGPSIGLRGAAALGIPAVFYSIAAFFLLIAALMLKFVQHENSATIVQSRTGLSKIPFPLMVLVPLATGVESAAGGWLATYSKRSGETLSMTVGAATCFWAGMLVSRALQSHRRAAFVSERWMVVLGPCLMTAALLLVLGSVNEPAILPGALILGIGVGPMYPLLLALTLRHGEAGNAMFALAGAGASLLPLFTGLVSGWTGSLRSGLLVPLLGSLVMLCIGGIVVRRASPRGVA
jgi:fucose permease